MDKTGWKLKEVGVKSEKLYQEPWKRRKIVDNSTVKLKLRVRILYRSVYIS